MAHGDTAKQELLNIKPAEVSLVDAAANEEEFLIVKRKGTEEQGEDMPFDLEISKGVMLDAIARERADDFAAAAAKLVELANDDTATPMDIHKQFDLIWNLLYKTENELAELAQKNNLTTPSDVFIAKMTESLSDALGSLSDDESHAVVKEKLEQISKAIGEGKPIVMREVVEVKKSITDDEMLEAIDSFLDSIPEEEVEKAKKITKARIEALKIIVQKASALLDDFTSSSSDADDENTETVKKDETMPDETTDETTADATDDAIVDDAGEETTDDTTTEDDASADCDSDDSDDDTSTEEDDSTEDEVQKNSNEDLLAKLDAMLTSKLEAVEKSIEKSIDEKIESKLSETSSKLEEVAKRQEKVETKIETRGVSKSASEDETDTEQEVKKNTSIFSDSVFTPRR